MPIIVPVESQDAHSVSCDSSLPPSTPSTPPLDSRSHIARATFRTLQHERRRSLGLIDAARVRISQDFRAILCSTHKLQRLESIASVETEETDHPQFVYPDYASNLRLQTVDVDVETMELSSHEERQGRTLGARIANFLNRSRSRSRKRRSRSLDAAVTHDPMPTEGATSSKHKRHSSLDPDGGYIAAVPSFSSRPATRSPSRPLSPVTKPRRSAKALVHHSSGAQTNGPVDIRTEVVILEQTSPNSSRKSKKMNFFGLTLSSPRMSSFGDSSKSKSRPPTPGSQPSSRKARGAPSRPGSAGVSPGIPDETKRSVKGDILLDHSRPVSPPVQTTLARCTTASPRHNGKDEEAQDDVDSEALQGRCSPLCGLGPSSAVRGKGKERERLEDWEQFEKDTRHRMTRTESERGKGRITNPRKVLSPTRELDKESRPLGGLSMERVASGSGTSRNSRGRDGAMSALPNGAQANIKAQRIKHGSFDFERPVSGGQARPLPSTNLNGRSIAAPHALQRTSSSRNPPRRVTLDDSRPDRHVPISSSLPKARAKPVLDIDTHGLVLTRRTTDSSTATSRGQTSAVPRNTGSKAHHGSETDPGSPISSTHSGHSSALNSSWGKSAGKRIARGAHPAFKFEPAVPTIPGSPAGSDERKRSIASSGAATSTPLSSLSKSKQARNAGKGRSLDLNLGLSWAPTKVREDAMSRTVGGRATPDLAARAGARWRTATADEEGRLGAGSSGAEVADAFREVLGDAAYSTFKTYVHRYDARAIPLDGPFGLMHHVQRLLDSAPGLDARRKQVLLHKLNRVVQEIR